MRPLSRAASRPDISSILAGNIPWICPNCGTTFTLAHERWPRYAPCKDGRWYCLDCIVDERCGCVLQHPLERRGKVRRIRLVVDVLLALRLRSNGFAHH